jgi:hypothetical protein
MLSDSIVQAVMEADGVDPKVLETELRGMAREFWPTPEYRPTSLKTPERLSF